MTEEEEIRAGRTIAKILLLRYDADYPLEERRWKTSWGNKTNLGLWRSVQSIVKDLEKGKNVQP